MKTRNLHIAILIVFAGVLSLAQIVSAGERGSVEEQLRALAEQHLESTYGTEQTVLYHVEIKRIPSLLKQRADTVIDLSYPGRDLPKGYVTYDVTWQTGNQRQSGKAQFYIKVEQKLPVLANRTPKGTLLSEDDFLTRWVDVTRYRGRFITDVNEAVGLVSSGFISSGRPLRPNDVTQPPIIDHGDRVTMIFMEKNMKVALEVTARSSAAKYEEFRAYCTETRRTYLVKAINRSQAEWIKTL